MLLPPKTGYDTIPHWLHGQDVSRVPVHSLGLSFHLFTVYLFLTPPRETWSVFPKWGQRFQLCTRYPHWDLSSPQFSPHHPAPALLVGLSLRPGWPLWQRCQRSPLRPSRTAESCLWWRRRLGETAPPVRTLSDRGDSQFGFSVEYFKIWRTWQTKKAYNILTLQSGKRRVLAQQHERNKIQSGVFRAYVTDLLHLMAVLIKSRKNWVKTVIRNNLSSLRKV